MKIIAKRFFIMTLCVALAVAPLSLSSCKQSNGDGRLKVLCTVFPIYDWVTNVTKDCEAVSVSLLVDNGTDLHSYQPSFADMAKIKESDVVIYVGGESDKWIEDSLESDTVAIKLSEIESVSLYSISSENIAQENAHDHEAEHEHTDSFDEHLWLSVRNAIAACRYISSVLSDMDADNSEIYEQNALTYINSLSELDSRLAEICSGVTLPVIFADRFPFVYLFNDYSVPYYAAFEGCSTDTNADFDTVIKLSDMLDDHACQYVLTTESPIDQLAQKAIGESAQKTASVISLDSMQSITFEDIAAGSTYLGIMEHNADVLQEIFN